MSSAAPPAPSLVLALGEEQLLVDRAVSAALAAARRSDPGVEKQETQAAGLGAPEFMDLVAPSLFAEPRVVVLRGTHEAAKELAGALTGYAADPVEGITLVIQHAGGVRNKALADAFRKAGAKVVACNKITKAGERLDFVRAEIRSAGGATTPDAVAAIVEAVGSDLRELAAATSQLVADTGGMVDETAVRRYHRGKAEVSGFTVADAAVAGDVAGALEAVRWAFGIGVAPVLIADALADGIRTVARVLGARTTNAYALASELGMPPWKVERAKSAARSWSEAGLARAIAVVSDLNGGVKGVAADAEYAVEKAVIDIVRARRLRL